MPHFARNTRGRDFVCGDIHGCFDAVESALAAVSFDTSRDRLFAVGDLVDRGSQCLAVPEWLQRPWFRSVRGNHEQMAIGIAGGRHDHDLYRRCGGGWFLDLPANQQQAIASQLATLPLGMEVETSGGLVGLVHADVPLGNWGDFRHLLEAQVALPIKAIHAMREWALWSRQRIESQDTTPVEGVAAVVVGHSVVERVAALGNVVFIDTGAVFGRSLSLLPIESVLALVKAAPKKRETV